MICEDEELGGYIVDALGRVCSQKEMAQELIETYKQKPYSLVIFDLNLGQPGSNDPDTARTFFKDPEIKKDFIDGKFKAVGISGNPTTVRTAKLEDLPAVYTSYFNIIEFLESIK